MTTDAIREAMATVRKHCELPANQRLSAGNEAAWTLARWLVANAGELVRVLSVCESALLNDGDPFSGDDWQLMQDIRRLAAALEPLLGEGGK